MPVDQVFEREFLKGQQLCEAGKDCPAGASTALTREYGAQYEMEQIETFKSINSRYRHKKEVSK